MLSHSGLMHAGIIPPAGDHPGLTTHIQYICTHVHTCTVETISHRHTDIINYHCFRGIIDTI